MQSTVCRDYVKLWKDQSEIAITALENGHQEKQDSDEIDTILNFYISLLGEDIHNNESNVEAIRRLRRRARRMYANPQNGEEVEEQRDESIPHGDTMKSVNEIIRILREDRKNGLKELDMNIFLTQEEIKQQLHEIDQSEDPDVLRILLINEKEE